MRGRQLALWRNDEDDDDDDNDKDDDNNDDDDGDFRQRSSVEDDRRVTRNRADSHNSMTHNDSQSALRKRRCDCRVDITVT